jgi:hypothetical protein
MIEIVLTNIATRSAMPDLVTATTTLIATTGLDRNSTAAAESIRALARTPKLRNERLHALSTYYRGNLSKEYELRPSWVAAVHSERISRSNHQVNRLDGGTPADAAVRCGRPVGSTRTF